MKYGAIAPIPMVYVQYLHVKLCALGSGSVSDQKFGLDPQRFLSFICFFSFNKQASIQHSLTLSCDIKTGIHTYLYSDDYIDKVRAGFSLKHHRFGLDLWNEGAGARDKGGTASSDQCWCCGCWKAIRYIILGPCQLDGWATLVAQAESFAAQMVV